jgi:hypothetical protein
MIYLAPALQLAPYSVSANNPRIGWHSIVTAANLSADEEATNYPVTNLANQQTFPKARWKGTTTAEQYVTVVEAATGVDYWGIASHNLGTTGATIQLEGSNDGSTWTPVGTEVSPGEDKALMVVFEAVSYLQWRLHITPGSAAPEIGIFNLGTVLTMQRSIFVGHTPMPFGIRRTVVVGASEDGHNMGMRTRREFLETGADFKNLTQGWVRSHLKPFLDASAELWFFWAWRPGDRPEEVCYTGMSGNPNVSNQSPNGMMQASWNMKGIE